MKNKVLITGIILLGVATILFFYLSNSNRVSGEKDEIILRIPDAKFMGLLPLYVADQNGYFKENNINIKWLDVQDPGQAEKLFMAGNVDLNVTTFANLLLAEARNPGSISLFIPIYETTNKPGSYFLVSPDSKIKSVSELKGKKIGTYSGPSQKAYLQMVLSHLGLMEKNYEIVQVATSSQIQALFGGLYDVLFTVEPYGTVAIQNGAKPIETGVRTKFIQNPFWVGSFEVSKTFSLDKPRMGRLIKALDKAIGFINSNEIEARKIMIHHTSIDSIVAMKCYLYNWKTNPTETDINQMQELVQKLVSEKILEKEVMIKSILYRK